MDPNSIVVNQEAPYSAYKQLASDCSFIRYLHWDNQIPEIDEFVDEAIACKLATALVACGRVLFLLSDDAAVSSEGWIKLAGESWRVTRQLGRFPGLRDTWQLCFSREPATVQELFYDAKYNWHLRGQIALFFPTDQAPQNFDLHSVLTAIKNEDLRGLPEYLGYLRPGDDGDFAELGMLEPGPLEVFLSSLLVGKPEC